MKKGHIIIVLSFLLFVILATAYSYSKYVTDVHADAEMLIAKWNISVNGCPGDESGVIECSTVVDGDDYIVNLLIGNEEEEGGKRIISYSANSNSPGSSYVKSGLFSPGTTGTFDLIIKPNDTDVSFSYNIVFKSLQRYDENGNKIDYTNPNITMTVNGTAMQPGVAGNNSVSGTIRLSEFQNNSSYELKLPIKVVWAYTENNSETDTDLGMSIGDPSLFVPFEITFTQIR